MSILAMWSGPRNISTAMMYAFANRPHTKVWDEPFYSHYLSTTGIEHPMGDEVIAAGEPEYNKVVESCLAPLPEGTNLFYQKHMTHHMLPGQDWNWCKNTTNAFLIRAPENVLASYAAKREDVSLADIGFERQLDLFNLVSNHLGYAPPVIDCEDILSAPGPMLEKLCTACNISYAPSMLNWEAGPKTYDGAWAPHWYNAAWKSTGFGDPKTEYPALSPELTKIADQARPIYEALAQHRLQAA